MNSIFNTNADTELDNGYEPDGVTANPGLVDQLVGEGKKYKTPDDLAFGKMNADKHIARLAEENAALRKAVSDAEALKALVAELKANTNADQGSTRQQVEETALDPKTLVDQIKAQLKEEQEQQAQASNREVVKQKLIEALGPNFGPEVKKRLAEAGLDEATANTLASKNPNAFLKLINVDAPRNTPGAPVPPTKVNTVAQGAVPNGERTKSYYDALKAKMGGAKAFNANRALVVQMHDDALRLGDKFFDK